MRIVKYDLQDAVGTIQLCAGQDAGCEAAVHAMERVFADEDTEAMILVDASNAFNCLNRQATLLNCGAVCPALSHILINTYRSNSQLFVRVSNRKYESLQIQSITVFPSRSTLGMIETIPQIGKALEKFAPNAILNC